MPAFPKDIDILITGDGDVHIKTRTLDLSEQDSSPPDEGYHDYDNGYGDIGLCDFMDADPQPDLSDRPLDLYTLSVVREVLDDVATLLDSDTKPGSKAELAVCQFEIAMNHELDGLEVAAI